MQELYQLIRERLQRVRKVSERDQYRELREEEKVRCERESWILSMFRAKKSLPLSIKKSYLDYSYAIMREIEPSFQYHEQSPLTDETFLNEFVCLYTSFFDQFESKFSFKTKMRSLLRPTNHNIVNDLIKYLSDFSKDYSQHIFFWAIKAQEEPPAKPSSSLMLPDKLQRTSSISHSSIPHSASNPQSTLFCQPKLAQQLSPTKRNLEDVRKLEDQEAPALQQKQFNRIYNGLDLQPQSIFVLSSKSKLSLDVIKLRINEMYRDLKYRNAWIKKAITMYSSEKNPTIPSNYSIPQQSRSNPFGPFRISLSVQKNGFSCLNLLTEEPRLKQPRQLELIADKKASSSLSNRDVIAQSQQFKGKAASFMLNSLKILRVSQNFLPPLTDSAKPKSEISTNVPTTSTERTSIYEVRSRTNNLGIQQCKNDERVYNERMEIMPRHGMVCYNEEMARDAERRKKQKRRISEMRKHFTSEERMKESRKSLNGPEDKIVEWLDKINMMKKLERRKIMGLV